MEIPLLEDMPLGLVILIVPLIPVEVALPVVDCVVLVVNDGVKIAPDEDMVVEDPATELVAAVVVA